MRACAAEVDEGGFPEIEVFVHAPREHHFEAFAELVECEIGERELEDEVEGGGAGVGAAEDVEAGFNSCAGEAASEGCFVVAICEYWSDGLVKQRWYLEWGCMKSGCWWCDIWCWDEDGKDIGVERCVWARACLRVENVNEAKWERS